MPSLLSKVLSSLKKPSISPRRTKQSQADPCQQPYQPPPPSPSATAPPSSSHEEGKGCLSSSILYVNDTHNSNITHKQKPSTQRHLQSLSRLQLLCDSICSSADNTSPSNLTSDCDYSVHTTRSSQTTVTSNRSNSESTGNNTMGRNSSRRNSRSRSSRYEEWQDDPEEPSRGRRLFQSRENSRAKELAKYESEEETSPEKYYTMDELLAQDIYKVRQTNGPCSIFFSAVQTLILLIMMIQCSIAPLNINPMVGPYPDALDYWGGKNAYKIINEGEMWRLGTPIFLHAGVIHLLCNVSVQLDIGIFWEREWGSPTWLCIYLTSAIGSSVLSCCCMPDNVSVGSSGAVMGLMGGKLAEVFCRACESKKKKQQKIAHEGKKDMTCGVLYIRFFLNRGCVFLLILIPFCLSVVRKEQFSQVLCSVVVVMLFSFVPYVDWAAHLGGLLAGFATGMCCFATWIKTRHCAFLWFIVGMALTVAYYGSTIIYMMTAVNPMDDLKDVCGYYQQYFEDYQCNCQMDNN